MPDRLDLEIQNANSHTRAMLAEYVAWGDKIVLGNVQQWLYNEIIEFVNFHMETAETCLQLIEREKIADALGLCRSLLEHYLLLMLMCRGHKFFRLKDRSDLTESQFKSYLDEEKAKLREQQEAGTTQVLAVEKYPRAKRHLMYVVEGLKSREDPEFVVSVHYFYFKEFRPEIMRLKRGDYFEYVEPQPDTEQAMKQYQQEAISVYRHYLSYDALLTCLELNDLVDQAAIARIEAHYTFLGQFLHPTHDAARDLHERSNYHDGQPNIGMTTEYTIEARLLASLYVCYLVSGILDAIAGLHESAPKDFITDAGVEELRRLIAEVPKRFSYFWFLFNDPPLYDKFSYCSYHVSKTELEELGHYGNVPNERVTFDQHIYAHLQHALQDWSNAKCGVYYSPLNAGR
jgi:hypothetical protein